MTERVISAMMAMQRHPWEQGFCAQALYEAGRDELWIPMAYDAIKRQQSDGRLAMVGGGAAVSDPAANGEVCLRAYERTGEELYLQGAQRMLDYLMNEAPRTPDGIICHNNVSITEGFSSRQLWIDGLYMAPPFLAVMGKAEEAAEQIRGYCRHLLDPETGVFFHIYDAGQGRFVRQKRWATGNGWALLGLIRTTKAAGQQHRLEIQGEMVRIYTDLLKAVLRYQTEDGRFHDILDEADSFMDGTSAMMMAASVFEGMACGLIPDTWRERAERVSRAMEQYIDGIGLIHQVCGCPDFLAEGTSTEAQAAYVMMKAWEKRLS